LGVLALTSPEKCLLQGDSWILGPEADDDRHGDVENVVFLCWFSLKWRKRALR
jgi:predicted GH43/DUF377 family glycosyl hydrolase